MKKTKQIITSLCLSASTLVSVCASGYGVTANAYSTDLSGITLSAPATAGETSGYFSEDTWWEIDEAGTLTIGGEGDIPNGRLMYRLDDKDSVKSVVISDGITSIGYSVFSDMPNLTSVQIADTVTSIGDGAFYRCTNLSTVNIPDSVTSIGENAFCYCESLETIKIPESVESIGRNAFESTKWLDNMRKEDHMLIINGILIEASFREKTTIEIPDTVTRINDSAFIMCNRLNSVIIPDSVTSIGEEAFSRCLDLTSVTIPESVTSIGRDAFLNTLWLENRLKEDPIVVVNGIIIVGKACSGDVVIPDTVTSINPYVFEYCNSIESVTIPDSVKSIGESAFKECKGLKSVTISGAAAIGESAFSGCENLAAVEIPNVTSIGDSAFSHCTELRSLTIPASVTSLDFGTLYYCDNFESITILNPDCQIDYYSSAGKTFTVYGYRRSSAEKYALYHDCTFKDIEGSENTSTLGTSGKCGDDIAWNIDEDGILTISGKGEIPELEFYKNNEIKKIVIEDGITGIAHHAFGNCQSLESVIIADTVTTIENNSFSNCGSLGSMEIPVSVTKIEACAFSNCESLGSIEIPVSVTKIGTGAFYNCKSLKEITIPDSVKEIEWNTLGSCDALETVNLKYKGIIPESMFSRCKNLKSVVVPETINAIKSDAFFDCENLESITILNPDCEIYNQAKTICNTFESGKATYSGVICGYKGSTAEEYANKYNYKFVPLDATETTTTSYTTSSNTSTVTTSTTPKVASKDYKAGDANCDGDVDLSDAVLIMQALANPNKYGESGSDKSHITKQGIENADVTGNDGMTTNDAQAIQKYLLKLVSELPIK